MAYGFRNFSRSYRCPICNGPDWCGIMPAEGGGELLVCQRDTVKSNMIGADGKFYMYICDSKRAKASIYEEAEQRRAKELQKQGKAWGAFDYARLQKKELIPVDVVNPLGNAELDKIYRELLSALVLEENHYKYLRSEGWTDELIKKHHVCSFPVKDFERYRDKIYQKNPLRVSLAQHLARQFGSLEGVPGAFLNKSGKWTFAGNPGILFPLYDAYGRIYRLRIRLDQDTGYGKYHNFSSFKADKKAESQGYLKNYFAKGCQAGNNIGVYMNGSDDMYLAYITEGEKKGIIGNHYLKNPVVSIPGVNSYAKLLEGCIGQRPIDILMRKGVRILIVAFDADKERNMAVLKSQTNLVEALWKEGCTVAVANWDMSLGKGLDDLLIGGNRPSYELMEGMAGF